MKIVRYRILLVNAHFKRLDMIYLIGGAPRAGKTMLAQRLCITLKVGFSQRLAVAESVLKF